MPIVRLEGDIIVETRSDLMLTDVPEHKRSRWRAIEGDPPAYDPRVETISGPALLIEPGRVVRQWTIHRKSDAEIAALVKMEARRRIMERFPEWKQTNMTARGVELQNIWRQNTAWTAGEQAEADALTAAWAWIKSTRSASDAIEAMQPIPADFADDARWPA